MRTIWLLSVSGANAELVETAFLAHSDKAYRRAWQLAGIFLRFLKRKGIRFEGVVMGLALWQRISISHGIDPFRARIEWKTTPGDTCTEKWENFR